MTLTIHAYYFLPDDSITVIPNEREIAEMMASADDSRRKHLAHFTEHCEILRPMCQQWTFNLDVPDWNEITALVNELPEERRTPGRLTTQLLPSCLGLEWDELNAIPTPVLFAIKEKIWGHICATTYCTVN